MTRVVFNYQAIPGVYSSVAAATVDEEEAMENGGGCGDGETMVLARRPLGARNKSFSSLSLPPLPASMMKTTTTPASWISKVGYIALGLIIGFCSSYSQSAGGRGRALWNPVVKINITNEAPDEDSPSLIVHRIHNRHNHPDNDDNENDEFDFEEEEGMSSRGHYGKSFSHSLPFEDAFPGMKGWAETLPSFITEETKLLSSSSPFSSFIMGASSSSSAAITSSGAGSSNSNQGGASSSLSSSSVASSAATAATTTLPVTPHLLYLVHPTAATLLYDTTKSSNYFVSEYSLDYFLLNSGGFDAQINQAYCAVVREKKMK